MQKKKTGKVLKTNNSEKTKLIMGIAMMIFAVAISVGTYAYYLTRITGTATGTILAWDCTNTGTASKGSFTSGTYTIKDSATNGDLKPGTSGSFAFKVKSSNFRTDITIQLSYANVANVPANFKLYKNSAHSSASLISMNTISNNTNVTAFTASNVAANTTSTHTVYWYWPIGTTSETPIATTADKTLTINYTITCNQASTYANNG